MDLEAYSRRMCFFRWPEFLVGYKDKTSSQHFSEYSTARIGNFLLIVMKLRFLDPLGKPKKSVLN